LDTVRFLKLFASTYLERFPRGDYGYKPIYPGSHFYAVVAAIALDIIENNRQHLDLQYSDAIKAVASFIGEGLYVAHTKKLGEFEINLSNKFGTTKDMETFNRSFRALVAHIEQVVPLPGMDVHSVPALKPIQALLELTKESELHREQKKEKERLEQEQERLEKEKARYKQALELAEKLQRTSFYDKSDDSDDYDGGFYASNGKTYNDYSEWYESDSYDEDWHD